MKESKPRKLEAEIREYIHLISREGTIFERRSFTEDLTEKLDLVEDKRKEGSDVVLAERVINLKYKGESYRILAVEKGRFIKKDGMYIGERYAEVLGAIVNERAKKIVTGDGIKLEVSEVKPILYDSIMRNMIKKEVGNLKLVDRDKIESNTYF